jgi:hypothetical protein
MSLPCSAAAGSGAREHDMGLLGGLDLPLVGGGGDDNEAATNPPESKGQGGSALAGMLGVGKHIDKGLNWMNDAGIDKYADDEGGGCGVDLGGIGGMRSCGGLLGAQRA